MQTLYTQKAYPEQIRAVINQSGQMGIELANRWMLGWPKRVKRLLAANEYKEAFLNQLEQEKEAIAANSETWLAPLEKVQMAGLSLEPPTL